MTISIGQVHTELLNRLEEVGVVITTDAYEATRNAIANAYMLGREDG